MQRTGVLVLTLAAAALAVLSPAPAAAGQGSFVTVTSNVLHNGDCLNTFCAAPHLFARAIIIDDTGTEFPCTDGPMTGAGNEVVANQILCDRRLVVGQFKVRFEMWDLDDAGPPMRAEQADLDPGADLGWTTPYAFWPGPVALRSYTTPGAKSYACFSVFQTPAPLEVTLTGGSGGTIRFSPERGERAWLSGDLNYPSRLRIVIHLFGGALTLADGNFQRFFDIDWDGRGLDGQIVPGGHYPYEAIDAFDPGYAVSGDIWVVPSAGPGLSIPQIVPMNTDPWDFSGGPLTVHGFATEPGTVTMTATQGRCGATTGPARTFGPFRRSGAFEVDWDGIDANGALAAADLWCVALSGTTLGDANTRPVAFTGAEMTVRVGSRAPGIEVIASLVPIAPALDPATPVFIRAHVLDTTHADRPAFDLTLTVAEAPATGSSVSFVPVVEKLVCTRATQCSWPLPTAFAGASAIAFSVTAREAPGLPGPAPMTATTGFRITDLAAAPGPLVRVDVPAVITPVDGGGSTIEAAPLSTTLDVVFYPGTGLAAGDPSGGRRFPVAIETAVNDIRGYGLFDHRRFPSSVLRSWANVGIWAMPDPVTVATGGDGLCTWSGLGGASFADVAGVLHGVSCRDNAPNRQFSASTSDFGDAIPWHELHHAAFGESDEYCCDGGYADGVNLYDSLKSCEDKGSDPTTCAMIDLRDKMGMVIDSRPWWRSDTGRSDVMWLNRIENPDDLRASDKLFTQCRGGGC